MPCRLSAGSTFLRLAWIVASVDEEKVSLFIYKQDPSIGGLVLLLAFFINQYLFAISNQSQTGSVFVYHPLFSIRTLLDT
jgi:hypothetical protein